MNTQPEKDPQAPDLSPALAGLQPKELWSIFNELRKVPRPSGREDKVRDWLYQWAADCEFEIKEDCVGNLCIHVPATTGFENAPTVCIQNHKDMVCVKESGHTFDFDNDSIELERDGSYITAKGTTLGADNGIGLAAAMALAIDPDVEHPALEILITCEEETTFKGAFGLDAEVLGLKADILLNFDFEALGQICVGSAGMEAIAAHLTFTRETLAPELAEQYAFLELQLSGFKGGHSGCEIHTDRGNAIITLAGMLKEIHPDLRLLSFSGGQAINAIPAEAKAIVAYNYTKVQLADIKARLLNSQAFSDEFAKQPNIICDITQIASEKLEAAFIPEKAGFDFLQALCSIPDGVINMHSEISELVETSSNLGLCETTSDRLTARVAMRSNVTQRLADVAKGTTAIFEQNEFEVENAKTTPAWEGNTKAPIIDMIAEAHYKVTGTPARVMTVHAGLEVGPIAERLEKHLGRPVQAVSYGPDIVEAHTPQEAVHINSTKQFYEEIKLVFEWLHPHYKKPEEVPPTDSAAATPGIGSDVIEVDGISESDLRQTSHNSDTPQAIIELEKPVFTTAKITS